MKIALIKLKHYFSNTRPFTTKQKNKNRIHHHLCMNINQAAAIVFIRKHNIFNNLLKSPVIVTSS